MASPTTPLILHDDTENRQELAGSSAGRLVTIAKGLSGILVSVLVVCSAVVVFHNHSQEKHAANNINSGDKPFSAPKFTNRLPNIDLKRIPVKLESNAEVEWQRSANHFQPDKNFISAIPTVDLSPFIHDGNESSQQKAKDTISEACTNLGVFQIENHGVSLDQMDQLMTLSKIFFNLPEKEKNKSTEESRPGAGYTNRPKDSFGNFDYLLMFPPGNDSNGVPTNPPDYRETFEEVFKSFMKTAQILEEILDELLGLTTNFLEEIIDYMIVLNYPPATDETDIIGIAEHEDPNLLTIILVDDVEGLEVFINGKWIPVIPTKGIKLVVILGDLIQVWSKNKFRYLTHRALLHKGTGRNCVNFCYKSPPLPRFRFKDYMDLKKKDDENPPSWREDFI